MATEVIDNQEETTEDQKGEIPQTVTIEQFEELTKKYESLMKTQSGSDAKVTDLLRQQKQEALDRANEKKTLEQKNADELAALNERLNKSEAAEAYASNVILVRQKLTDAGLPVPRGINTLVGKTEEETLKYVEDYIADRQDEEANKNSKIAKKFSRVIDDTNKKSQEKMSWEDMNKLSRADYEELERNSPELVRKTMEAAIGAKK